VRLGNPVVPRYVATAVDVGSAAVRNAGDTVRSSADQWDLYAELSGPGSIIAGAIEAPALTSKSCASSAAAWANDACVLTSTFAEAAAGQHTRSPLAIDNLLRHSPNNNAIGASAGGSALEAHPSAQCSQPWHRPPSSPPAKTIASRRNRY
jgi:hypothetical protein